MEIAEPFPRGLGPTSEKRSISSSADKKSKENAVAKKDRVKKEDFLFGSKDDDKNKAPSHKKIKTSKGSSVAVAASVNPLGGGGIIPSDQVKRRPAIIESVGFSKLTPKHTKVLGIVRDVTEDFAIISLPNMLTGFIQRSVNDLPITSQVSKNTVLAVSIQSTSVEHVKNEATPKRRIEVSIHPRHMNRNLSCDNLHEQMRLRGIISSKEDHGCIVHVHIPGVTCFLPFDNVHQYNEEDSATDNDDDDSSTSSNSIAAEKDTSSSKNNNKKMNHRHLDNLSSSYSLRPGRIYDFIVTKITRHDSSGGAAARTMIQLLLPDLNSAAKILELAPSLTQAKQGQLAPHTMNTITPGMLVKCYIEGYAKNGLLVNFFLGLFRGAIEANHMGGYYVEEGKTAVDWRTLFRESGIRYVTARIIVADPTTKIIRLSLLPHLVQLRTPILAELPPLGTVVRNAVVLRVDKGIGALLAIPQEFSHALPPPSLQDEEETEGNEDDGDKMAGRKRKHDDRPLSSAGGRTRSLYSIPQHFDASKIRCVYVHISKASDVINSIVKGKKDLAAGTQLLKEMEFAKQFKVGSVVPAVRIISSQSWVENIASGATAPSIVDASVLSHSDIKPGLLYRNVPIISTGDYGILVSLGQNIKAMCPFLHMYDKGPVGPDNITTSRAFAKMFAVGKKINVRCIVVEPESKRCIVTHKPSLVKDSGFIVCSYENLPPPHEVVKGYVSKCVNDGLMVTFYNNIYGWCSSKSLNQDLGVEDVTVSYKVGDVVKCRITKANFNDNRWYLTVSLDISDRAIAAAAKGERINNSDTLLCSDEETLSSFFTPGRILPSSGMIMQMVNSQRSSAGRLFCGYATVRYIIDEQKGFTFDCRLPFELVFDSLPDNNSQQEQPIQIQLDRLVGEKIRVGQKVDMDAVVIGMQYAEGNVVPFISTKPRFVSAAAIAAACEKQGSTTTALLLPSSATELYVGANAVGYVYHIDERHGAFIRFLNKLTGIVPKARRGLELPLYHTISCTVGALDLTKKPPKILLRKLKSKGQSNKQATTSDSAPSVNVGDCVNDAEVESVNFLRAKVRLLDSKYNDGRIRARVHVTMASECLLQNVRRKENITDSKIKKHHPFYKWKTGTIVRKLYCVAIEVRENISYLELSTVNPKAMFNRETPLPSFIESESKLTVGQPVCGIVTAILPRNFGVKVQISPGIVCFIPGFELEDVDADKLNNIVRYFPIGSRISCSVIKVAATSEPSESDEKPKTKLQELVQLSVVRFLRKVTPSKPVCGDLVIGRINTSVASSRPPSLMLDLPGGYVGRCCITELNEVDEWENMPLGRNATIDKKNSARDSQDDLSDPESEADDDGNDLKEPSEGFPNGKYVQCRVLSHLRGSATLEVSFRESRIEGDLDEDEVPETNDIVSAYVCETNHKGCFLRLSRNLRGRVMLKELSDSFLPDPANLFQVGRLVIGKVKNVNCKGNPRNANASGAETTIDIDMRESSLLGQDKLSFDDILEGSKYKGVVTRVEKYGVFVRIDGSDVSGMAHLSESSDIFVKQLSDLFDPGDRVKVLVLKVDKEQHRVSLGLKASYFEDDLSSDSEEDSDEETSLQEKIDDCERNKNESDMDEDSIDSEDEEYVSKLAEKMASLNEDSGSSDENDDSIESDSNDTESEDDISADTDKKQVIPTMDTNVGFLWTTTDERQEVGTRVNNDASDDDETDSSSVSGSNQDEGEMNRSHKSRHRASQKRKEEKEIATRELALADGTADDSPETAKDFERLLASEPNSSEYWIKYMAFHLSLANIDAARRVAQRAFDRIEFRQENEKLNVWAAYLTLELKYGSGDSLDAAVESACKQNNPKQVYLRMCEILEKDVDAATENGASISEVAEKANSMFLKMCKRFKSKKTVWLAYVKYQLKMGNHEEASNLLKRSLLSLPGYKHVEVVSKVAELEFELGSPERGRTLFNALLAKNRKRLDLLFVFIDKELKCQNIGGARALFKGVVQPCSGSLNMKLNDKQMKSLFKKWYRIEETHGDLNSQNQVKLEATSFVQRSAAAIGRKQTK